MAYATLDDLQKRWRPLNPSESERAIMLLDDAAVLIQAEFKRDEKEIDVDDELLSSALKIVSCSIVKRMMSTPASVDGVSQMYDGRPVQPAVHARQSFRRYVSHRSRIRDARHLPEAVGHRPDRTCYGGA